MNSSPTEPQLFVNGTAIARVITRMRVVSQAPNWIPAKERRVCIQLSNTQNPLLDVEDCVKLG